MNVQESASIVLCASASQRGRLVPLPDGPEAAEEHRRAVTWYGLRPAWSSFIQDDRELNLLAVGNAIHDARHLVENRDPYRAVG